jgi:glucose-1-phosphate cytidylyltransferase
MKVVILAGGMGTRISEESHLKPKPMVEIGDMPILWHIMKGYSHCGYDDFVICCGYKGLQIKQFFADYYLHRSDITFDFSRDNEMVVHSNVAEPWRVTLVDTGLNTMTGGRIRRVVNYLGDEPFMLTYGDGVSDVDIQAVHRFHKAHGKLATITAIQPGGRFGMLGIGENDTVEQFIEKSADEGGWVNGGFMIFESKVLQFIEGDHTVLEKFPLEHLAAMGELKAYKHHGFWQCMDTLRDKVYLEKLWESGQAPWKAW